MSEDSFSGGTDAQRRMRRHIQNFINLPMEDCTCGCRGYPINLLPNGSIDYVSYKSCLARLKRTNLPGYKAFKESPEYLRDMPSEATRRTERKQEKLRQKQLIEREKEEQAVQIERERTIAQQMEWARHRSKLPALSRQEALRRNLKTFQGNLCAAGHDGERLAKNGECVVCRAVDKTIRGAMKRGAYPENLTPEEREEIVAIYAQSRRITEESGIDHHVDHRVPLAAGGRHHPSNLQIITANENLKKGALHNGIWHQRSIKDRNSSCEEEAIRGTKIRNGFQKQIETKPKGFWSWLFRPFR